MSLLRCPECGKDISDTAQSCPNCGHCFIDTQELIREEMRHLKKRNVLFSVFKALSLVISTIIISYYVFVVCGITIDRVTTSKSTPNFSISEQELITAAKCLQKSLYLPETIRIREAILKKNEADNEIVALIDYMALTLGNTYKNEIVYVRIAGQMYDIQREPEENGTREENNKEVLNNSDYTFTIFNIQMNGTEGWTRFEDLTSVNEYLQKDTSKITYSEMADKY